MGFNKERGDTLNIVNSAFAVPEKLVAEDTPLWKQTEIIQTAKEVGKYIIGAALLMYIFFKYLKPTLVKLTGQDAASLRLERAREDKINAQIDAQQTAEEDSVVNLSNNLDSQGQKQMTNYEINMDMAKQLAASDPKIVANVIKTWVSNE
jgi:flagellar M-ring protein FliF